MTAAEFPSKQRIEILMCEVERCKHYLLAGHSRKDAERRYGKLTVGTALSELEVERSLRRPRP